MQRLQNCKHSFDVPFTEVQSGRLLEALVPQFMPQNCHTNQLLADLFQTTNHDDDDKYVNNKKLDQNCYPAVSDRELNPQLLDYNSNALTAMPVNQSETNQSLPARPAAPEYFCVHKPELTSKACCTRVLLCSQTRAYRQGLLYQSIAVFTNQNLPARPAVPEYYCVHTCS